MHLEIRKIGKSKKYYLAHSFREGSKVHKLRRFLGTNLTKEQIGNLRKKAEGILSDEVNRYKIISNPLTHELEPREIQVIKGLQKEIPLKIEHLSKEDWKLFTEQFTYDTNAIEGSTVNFGEVESILEKDEWPKDKSRGEISETYGVSNAIDYIRETKEHISLELILEIHKICFKNSKKFAGKFRSKGVEVAVKDKTGRILHIGASSSRIKSLLTELIMWYEKHKKLYPPLLLAAVVHNQFEVIHPFEDGNGRVGRILLNNVLIKHGLPPVNITLKHQAKYYFTLSEYQDTGNTRPIIKLILNEYKQFHKHR